MSTAKIRTLGGVGLLGETPALIHVLPYKIQKKRLEDIISSMRKKNLPLSNDMNSAVTHVVTEFDCLEQVDKHTSKDRMSLPGHASVVSMKWLVACLKASRVVPVLDCHILKKTEVSELQSEEEKNRGGENNHTPEWACQRVTRLQHFNHRITDALESLQLHAELRDSNQDYQRALAFRRASCVIKSLPFTVTDLEQLAGLKDIGGHVKRVIADILENGHSSEVKEILDSDWFKQMKIFTSIFGVGPATAKSWISQGWSSVESVKKAGFTGGDWRIKWGLAYYEDLITPVMQLEAQTFTSVVQDEVEKILPGAIVSLTGGFRRGKETGHDVDLLITHPTEGREVGVLPELLAALIRRDMILIGHREKNSYRADILYHTNQNSLKGQLDHFEKWLGICKFPTTFRDESTLKKDFKDNTGKPELASEPQYVLHDQSISLQEPKSQNLIENDQCHISGQSNFALSISDQKLEGSDTRLVNHHNCEKLTGVIDSSEELFEPLLKKSKLSFDHNQLPDVVPRSDRSWIARRVDLIVCPFSQYYYALVGWTGNKHFNRDARLYAQKVLSMKLTSHGLYDLKQQTSLPAYSEEDVFRHLKIPFRPPSERNC